MKSSLVKEFKTMQHFQLFKKVSLTAMLTMPLIACAGIPAVVRQGDNVGVSFTCRLPDGRLAATTLPDSSVVGEAKSPFYLPRTGLDTVTIMADKTLPDSMSPFRQPFEQEILQRLAALIPGLKEGGQAQWILEAERYPVSSPNEKLVKLAKTRKRQKEMRLSIEEYTNKTGKNPEVGQPFVLDKLVPGKVREVTENEVVIRFTPIQGKDLVTPFGPVTVQEKADHYELEIGAEAGRLIRTGGMAGRIISVDKESITIDYGHPFAGEILKCDVKVESVEPRKREESAPAQLAPPQQDAAKPSEVLAIPAPDPDVSQQIEEALRTINKEKQTESGAHKMETVLMAAIGDLAVVNYTAMLEDGAVFYTTRKSVAEDTTVKKVAWFSAPASFAGESVTVGKAALFPGIGEELEGMSVGGVKRLLVPPEKAFGPTDPLKLEKLPLVRTMPRTIKVSAEEYAKRFNSSPVAGQEIPLTPYFPARVSAVSEREVELELLAENGKIITEPFGTTVIKVDGEKITTTLTPVIGGIFPEQNGYGVITSTDATSFTLDMNNPLAGKIVTIDLELSGLTRQAGHAAGSAL
jgi:FKBP-type peptidyl-prolyl cis-trans isomerase 2